MRGQLRGDRRRFPIDDIVEGHLKLSLAVDDLCQRPATTATPADSARAEAVEILAGAVFTLLLSGRVPFVDAGKIDVMVVYKVDRLSRSLLDFAKVMERFNATGASFVSVTQNFSTADAMAAHAQHADELRRVRTRDDRRAYARQDRRRAAEGEMDGRPGAPRLLGRGQEARGRRT